MSLRTIMIFPEFENMYVIDPVRNRYDPLAKLVRPHITIVFPFESDMSNEELSAVLDRRLADVGPFEIEMKGFTKQIEPFGNYLILNMTKGADEIRKIHDELYANEFKSFDKGIEYVPHMTVGKLETEAALDDAFSTVKYKRDVFTCTVNKISVEMIGEHEESIIILEKELKQGAGKPFAATVGAPVAAAVAAPVVTPVSTPVEVPVAPVSASVTKPATVAAPAAEPVAAPSAPADRTPDAEYEQILKAVKTGDYITALTLLKKTDPRRDMARYTLLKLLSLYKVSSTEDLLNRVIANASLTKHLLMREELETLAVALSSTDNRLDAYMVEYCMLCLRLSGIDKAELYRIFRTNAKASSGSQYKSAFAKMDSEDAQNLRRERALENAKTDYEFDFFEELNDIHVKYKSAVSNPDRTFESVALANLSLIGDLAILGARAGADANPYDERTGTCRYVSEHDYGVNKPPEIEGYDEKPVSSSDNAMTKYIGSLEKAYTTDSDRQARLSKLTGLIRQDEEKILKGTYRLK